MWIESENKGKATQPPPTSFNMAAITRNWTERHTTGSDMVQTTPKG